MIFQEFFMKKHYLEHISILPRHVITQIPGLELCPFSIVRQETVSAMGQQKEKNRIVHDLSYNVDDEENAINGKIQLEDYPEVQYGRAISRVLYSIHYFSAKAPHKQILVAKFDYNNAYRRIHLSSATIFKVVLYYRNFCFYVSYYPLEQDR